MHYEQPCASLISHASVLVCLAPLGYAQREIGLVELRRVFARGAEFYVVLKRGVIMFSR